MPPWDARVTHPGWAQLTITDSLCLSHRTSSSLAMMGGSMRAFLTSSASFLRSMAALRHSDDGGVAQDVGGRGFLTARYLNTLVQNDHCTPPGVVMPRPVKVSLFLPMDTQVDHHVRVGGVHRLSSLELLSSVLVLAKGHEGGTQVVEDYGVRRRVASSSTDHEEGKATDEGLGLQTRTLFQN